VIFLRFSPANFIPPWAPLFRKVKQNIAFIHSSIPPSTHPHPGTDKRPVKAASVQWDVSLTPITRNTRNVVILHTKLIKCAFWFSKEDKNEILPVNYGVWMRALWKLAQESSPQVGTAVAWHSDIKQNTLGNTGLPKKMYTQS
jgi:hypothetical protein